jgi:polysaccharide deacetylase family protein (PEP-CTERM system associated)
MTDSPTTPPPQAVLTFDVEEHWRIEAASGLSLSQDVRDYYDGRVAPPTYWLLDQLAQHDQKATFFVVGQLARRQPDLVRAMHRAGHEVASHGWNHRRVHNLSPAELKEDVRQSKDILEQITGAAVRGYRAPTFSIVRQTAWALDVLAEQGFSYDSSIYPVRHDRYGVPEAPRGPFLARGTTHAILELPPVRLDLLGLHLPMAGGGYFRLFPLCLLRLALRQSLRDVRPPVAVLYFHPWEFDPDQARLPLGRFSRFRTYVGLRRSRPRLGVLLRGQHFVRAADTLPHLQPQLAHLPQFSVAGCATAVTAVAPVAPPLATLQQGEFAGVT